MPTALVTGSGGLIGSQCVASLTEAGFDVIGLETDMRAQFFGPAASTARASARLRASYPTFRAHHVDVRDADGVRRVVAEAGRGLELVVHAAAQPSHDWAGQDPLMDFEVNARGTLNVLEAVRRHQADATFAFMSTNKVYGDSPNSLPLVDGGSRLELEMGHRYFKGIDTSMSIDRSMHSVFGASKVAADMFVQEYGRYFGMPTVCFRAGCLSGPGHAGTELHGFLSYLVRCAITGQQYTVYGHGGKQVRDNLHAADVAQAIRLFHSSPRPAAVYNLGGGRANSVSVIEAIEICAQVAGREVDYVTSISGRRGDHLWWITDLSEFQRDYPMFRPAHSVADIVGEIVDFNAERWAAMA
jgi:CDP-paratose 2-epimerase